MWIYFFINYPFPICTHRNISQNHSKDVHLLISMSIMLVSFLFRTKSLAMRNSLYKLGLISVWPRGKTTIHPFGLRGNGIETTRLKVNSDRLDAQKR